MYQSQSVISNYNQSHPVISSHIQSQPVISSHNQSYPVTTSHSQSYPVTTSHNQSQPVITTPFCTSSARYNCNRFDEDAAVKARTAQEVSRAALQRYLHYCNRYMNHMQSLKFENKVPCCFLVPRFYSAVYLIWEIDQLSCYHVCSFSFTPK